MKIQEIIKAIEETKSQDCILQFVSDKGYLFYPLILKNNCIEMTFDYDMARSDRGYTICKIKLSELIHHLNNNTNATQLMFLSIYKESDYFISGWCDLGDHEGGYFEISPTN